VKRQIQPSPKMELRCPSSGYRNRNKTYVKIKCSTLVSSLHPKRRISELKHIISWDLQVIFVLIFIGKIGGGCWGTVLYWGLSFHHFNVWMKKDTSQLAVGHIYTYKYTYTYIRISWLPLLSFVCRKKQETSLTGSQSVVCQYRLLWKWWIPVPH
jgi:hypothetical protein